MYQLGNNDNIVAKKQQANWYNFSVYPIRGYGQIETILLLAVSFLQECRKKEAKDLESITVQ